MAGAYTLHVTYTHARGVVWVGEGIGAVVPLLLCVGCLPRPGPGVGVGVGAIGVTGVGLGVTASTTSDCHSTNFTLELPGPSVSSQSLEEEWNEHQREAPKLIFLHVLQSPCQVK